MSESLPSLRTSNPDALREYKTGIDQRNQGQPDLALTSFRRAVIADPNFVEAQLQIGLLCKEKARREPMFRRYVFDAFRAVARLDPANASAHDQYILAAQESGRLAELHTEYEALAKNNSGNEIFQRCFKNIMTLEMAMIPQRVDVASSRASGGIRKILLVFSIGMAVIGIACIFLPLLFKKGQVQHHWGALAKAGLGLVGLGLGGIVGFTQMN